MISPKAVVFDLGKVLLDFDYTVAASRLEARSKISSAVLKKLLVQSPLLLRYETGLLTTEDFFGEVQRLSGFGGDLAEFSQIFGDIFTPIEPMIELHVALRGRGLSTYLFSNTNPLAVQHVRRRFSFFRLFDGHVLSCDHGTMKPDPRLYEVVERLVGYRGSDLLYIDDRPENIATGNFRGWQTILHVRPEKTIEAVRQTGILV